MIIQLSKTEKQSRSLKGYQFHCSGRYGKGHPFMICHKMLIPSIGLKNKRTTHKKKMNSLSTHDDQLLYLSP